jgi:hypothetical protein
VGHDVRARWVHAVEGADRSGSRLPSRKDFAELGVLGAESLTIDVPAVLARVRKICDTFVDETRHLTADLGDRAISGRARLLGPTVHVSDEAELCSKTPDFA